MYRLSIGNRKMWETSMNGLLSLVRRTTPCFTYLREKIGSSFTDKMDALACFAPGMLALGASGYGPTESQKFLSLAEEIYCCVLCRIVKYHPFSPRHHSGFVVSRKPILDK
ncbi:unnamed protein product [Cuscuta epithymum]|uniref:Uncharacterized protein n=1 Tax=Cuscuta epithymum TaxID=186058 RepID=A0AAV0EEU6_9ASTE|nr:unnamed protein product [Cuscuta epithymum]